MYINTFGNVLTQCVIATKPVYWEEAGENRTEMAKATAYTKEMTPDGVQRVNLNLLFFSAMAVPAMKLHPGLNIMVAGRESSKQIYRENKYTLERTLCVEWWEPRDVDPCGKMEELKVRREIAVQKKEYGELFAGWLGDCKKIIIGWFIEWFKEHVEAVKLKKPLDKNNTEKGKKRNDQEPDGE